MQEQEPALLSSLHIAFDPQGDGVQGDMFSTGVAEKLTQLQLKFE